MVTMLTIYHRTGEVGENAFSEVAEFLEMAGYDFDEIDTPAGDYDAGLFGGRCLRIKTKSWGSFILDKHKGLGNREEILFHAPEDRLMPSGLSRMLLLNYNGVPEVSHGPSCGKNDELLNQAYVEVIDKKDTRKLGAAILDFLGKAEQAQKITAYTAKKELRPAGERKKEKWVVEKRAFEIEPKPTMIICEGRGTGVPLFIRDGIEAIRDAVRLYNFDILGASPVDTELIYGEVAYLFESQPESAIIDEVGEKASTFVMNKNKSRMRPYFPVERRKNFIVDAALNKEQTTEFYSGEEIKEIQDSIFLSVLRGDISGAEYLLGEFKRGRLKGRI